MYFSGLQEQERDNESSKKLAEELSFKNLQEEHGMGESHCKVSYKQQAVKNMEKSVGRKKMSSFEYYKCIHIYILILELVYFKNNTISSMFTVTS